MTETDLAVSDRIADAWLSDLAEAGLAGIDMREVFVDLNVIAEPPPGQTLYRQPADFEKVDTVAERLTLALSEGDGKIKLSIQ